MLRANVSNEKTVLLVDDDEFVREDISVLLLTQGYSVLQAENGQKGLDVLKKVAHFPCLVVLDLAMPVMDGRGFLTQRAQDPILRTIPVVVVSGIRRGQSHSKELTLIYKNPSMLIA